MNNTQNETNTSESSSNFLKLKKESFELIRFIILAGIIIIPFRIFIAQPFIVNGASMNPTFETGQYLIVDQVTYRNENPERGDVVIFRFPLNPKDFYIKRIIGLPNETVTIEGSSVYIQQDGENTRHKLEEPYIEFEANNNLTVTLGSDEYFVMGDNRPNSSDSRHWGVLPKKFIVGRAYLRLLPLKTMNVLPGEYHQEITDDTL